MATMARPINGQAGESYLWPRKSPYYFDKDKLLPTPAKCRASPTTPLTRLHSFVL